MRALAGAGLLALVPAGAARADKTVQVGPGNTFTLSMVTVAPGETVTWNFNEFHTSTSDATMGPEVWDSGFLSIGTFSHTFSTPGTYPYYCQVHSFPGGTAMNGEVQVVGATATPTRTPTPIPTPTPTPTPTVTPAVPGASLHAVTPCRIVDTRDPAGPQGGPALQAGATRNFPVAGICSVPPTAKAVAVNLTVVSPTAAGHLTLYAAGSALPLASTINFRTGIVRANNAILPLGTAGQISVACGMGSGSTDFVLDVTGYFE